MNKPSVLCCALPYALAVTVAVHAQEFDERSIPEPTVLAVEASTPGAQVREIAEPRRVESGNSGAEIDAVEVIAPGHARLRGVRGRPA